MSATFTREPIDERTLRTAEALGMKFRKRNPVGRGWIECAATDVDARMFYNDVNGHWMSLNYLTRVGISLVGELLIRAKSQGHKIKVVAETNSDGADLGWRCYCDNEDCCCRGLVEAICRAVIKAHEAKKK